MSQQHLPSKHPLLSRKPGPFPGGILSSPISQASYQIPMNVPLRGQPYPQGLPQGLPQQYLPQQGAYLPGPGLSTLSPSRHLGGPLLSGSPGKVQPGMIQQGQMLSSPGYISQSGNNVVIGPTGPMLSSMSAAEGSLDDRFLRCIQRSEFLVQTNRHILDRTAAQRNEDRNDLSLNELFERAIQRSSQTISKYSSNSQALTNTINNTLKRKNSSSDEEKSKKKENDQNLLKSEFIKGGDRYEGETVDGKRQGSGKYFYANGDFYEGEWADDKKNGYGELKSPNGEPIYKGEWKNDKFDGRGTWYNLFPDVYREPFNYNDFDDLENKWTVYEGDFKEGKFHGEGKLSISNGEVFIGKFNLGMIEGRGNFYSAQDREKIVEGIWSQNRLEQRL
jgi:hypothetical protein